MKAFNRPVQNLMDLLYKLGIKDVTPKHISVFPFYTRMKEIKNRKLIRKRILLNKKQNLR